jgi:hypothetical protein
MRFINVPAACVVACGGALLCATGARAAVIVGLGNLPGGASSSFAALSGDGSTIVTSGAGTAYRWRAGAWQDLGNPGSDVTVHGVSGDGNVVTGAVPVSAGATVFYPRVWRDGSWMNLPLLDNPAIGRGIARTANADGSIVVGPVRRISTQVATRWGYDAGTYQVATSNLFGDEANVEGVSADGNTLAGWSVFAGHQGDRAYTLATGFSAVAIDGPTGPISPASNEDLRATAINAAGLIVAGVHRTNDASAWQVWRRLGAGATQILGAGEAFDVSISGIIAAGSFVYDASGTQHGVPQFLVSNGASVAGWNSLSALGISDDGMTLAGTGLRETSPGVFQNEAWIATIPAPSGAAALAMLGLGALRRRR